MNAMDSTAIGSAMLMMWHGCEQILLRTSRFEGSALSVLGRRKRRRAWILLASKAFVFCSFEAVHSVQGLYPHEAQDEESAQHSPR